MVNLKNKDFLQTKKYHEPVLLDEIIKAFIECPVLQRNKNIKYFDGTFGRGGHLSAILEKFPYIKAYAIDWDLEAVLWGKQEFECYIKEDRLEIFQENFKDFSSIKDKKKNFPEKFDFMLLDLGLSVDQILSTERGFSFYHDGPLDMRIDPINNKLTASEIINEYSFNELKEIFLNYGEIFKPSKVINAILKHRDSSNFNSTKELANLIEKIEGWRKKNHHPATKYFQALRININEELFNIQKSIPDMIDSLNDEGGRLAIITFHSLEDRIIKNIFKSNLDKGFLVNKKVIQATRDEIKKNPKARSAKLRIFEKSINKSNN